jgi:hypothetical protein
MANRRLIARHATWANRYRAGIAWSFTKTSPARERARAPSNRPQVPPSNHDSVTSSWSEPPQSHIVVVPGRGPLVLP